MATHFLLRRGGTLALAIAMSVISLSAQTATVTHVIDRGETIETIAEKYGVTPQAIIDLNPAAAQFVYVGMELTIPAAPEAQNRNVPVVSREGAAMQDAHVQAQNAVEYNVPSSSVSTSGAVSGVAEEVTPNSFCHYGAAYHTSFEHFDLGTYGVTGSVYSPGGWGGNLFLGGSWGLTDPAVFSFEVGPSFCYAFSFSPNVALATDLNFCGSFMWVDEAVVKTSSPSKYGNHYYPAKDYVTTESKQHFGWGIVLQPTLVLKFGGFMPMAGLRIWGQDEKDINGKSKFKFHVGLALGICFNA